MTEQHFAGAPAGYVVILWSGPHDCDYIEKVYGPFQDKIQAETWEQIIRCMRMNAVTEIQPLVFSANMGKFL